MAEEKKYTYKGTIKISFTAADIDLQLEALIVRTGIQFSEAGYYPVIDTTILGKPTSPPIYPPQ